MGLYCNKQSISSLNGSYFGLLQSLDFDLGVY